MCWNNNTQEFRIKLPRLFELYEKTPDPNAPQSCFQQFPEMIQDPKIMSKWLAVERELQGLAPQAWHELKNEAKQYVNTCDINGRGRHQLLENLLNPARAYNYLKRIGCSQIGFIPRGSGKTPDLQACLGSMKVICEVKTINPSDDEIALRKTSIRSDNPVERLESGFFNKILGHIEKANQQLAAVTPMEKETKRMMFFVIHFDDYWGEHKQNYYQQIDEWIPTLGKICEGIDFVFYNQRTPEGGDVAMANATAFNEGPYPEA